MNRIDQLDLIARLIIADRPERYARHKSQAGQRELFRDEPTPPKNPEFERQHPRAPDGEFTTKEVWHQTRAEYHRDQRDQPGYEVARTNRQYWNHVGRALEQGKPVPDHIAAEYHKLFSHDPQEAPHGKQGSDPAPDRRGTGTPRRETASEPAAPTAENQDDSRHHQVAQESKDGRDESRTADQADARRPAPSPEAVAGHAAAGQAAGSPVGSVPGVVPKADVTPKTPKERPETGDQLPGGKADTKTDSDFDPKALAKGQAVEMEHTDDPEQARKIARDHLRERPDYYDRLEEMERSPINQPFEPPDPDAPEADDSEPPEPYSAQYRFAKALYAAWYDRTIARGI